MQNAELKNSVVFRGYFKKFKLDMKLGKFVREMMYKAKPKSVESIMYELYAELRLHRFVGTSWFLPLVRNHQITPG